MAVSELYQEDGPQHMNIKEFLRRRTVLAKLPLRDSCWPLRLSVAEKLRTIKNIIQQGQDGSRRFPWYLYVSWSEGRFFSLPVIAMVLRLSGKKTKLGSFASL